MEAYIKQQGSLRWFGKYCDGDSDLTPFDVGDMDLVCECCGALHFEGEITEGDKKTLHKLLWKGKGSCPHDPKLSRTNCGNVYKKQ